MALLHHKPTPCFPPTPDFKHRITVQASPGLDRRRNVFEVGAGDSPTFPRFRAIQCKKPLHATPPTHTPVIQLLSNFTLVGGCHPLSPPPTPSTRAPSHVCGTSEFSWQHLFYLSFIDEKSEKSNLPNVTQLTRGRARIQTQASLPLGATEHNGS